MSVLKLWKTLVALALVYVSIYFQWSWFWGVIFMLWTIRSILTGETFLVEPVGRSDYPVVFWIIIVTWTILSLYMILIDVSRLF